MVEMTSEERVLCVAAAQEPDRVPHFEWLVDRRVREALCPGLKGSTMNLPCRWARMPSSLTRSSRRKGWVRFAG